MDPWPGYDVPQPVIINQGGGRPGHYRPRQASEHLQPQPAYYTGPNGQLLVPAVSGNVHRSHSAAGRHARPPAQVIINNENALVEIDEHYDSRPRSSHGHRHHGGYYHEDSYSDRSRSRDRSRSHVRMRTPSPYYESEYEIQVRLRRLDELERKDEDDRRKKRIEEELLIKSAKEAVAKEERKKEEEELKKKAIAEYNAKQAEEKEKKKKAEEEADREYKERMWRTLRANGYSDHEIEHMIRRGEHGGHEHGGMQLEHFHGHGDNEIIEVVSGHQEHGHGHGHGHQPQAALALARPTFIKVHKKHLDPETLDVYELPWDWDEVPFFPHTFPPPFTSSRLQSSHISLR